MNLEQYIGKKVQFDFIPFDSPLYGKPQSEDKPFHNEEILVGVIERNNGTLSHYALRFENGESIAIRDDQHKWIFNLKEIKND